MRSIRETIDYTSLFTLSTMPTFFQNSGELDIQLVSTFGCSVKETSNPIGFFGTGLKYALAVLLRTGHEVTILSGETVLNIHARTTTLRGKPFQCVYANDLYLGFTTELGKNWGLWMAYRELFCNAQDEPNAKVWTQVLDNILPLSNFTTIVVKGRELEDIHATRDTFLLLSPPDVVCGATLQVHLRPSTGLFYKGVRVSQFQCTAKYTYNITGALALTEDRTCASDYDAARIIGIALTEHATKDMLKTLLTLDHNFHEHFFDYNWNSATPSTAFLETVQELESDQSCTTNASALAVFHRRIGRKGIRPTEIELTAVEKKTLEKASAFCTKLGYPVAESYPVKIAESLGVGVLALAERSTNTIFLTKAVFTSGGTKGVASALIEEYIHLKYNLDDLTRSMQTHLFDKIVSLGEDLQGEPL